MATLSLIVLVVLAMVLVVGTVRDSSRIYQYPFTAAAVFMVFIAPPLFGLLRTPDLPRWTLGRYALISVLSLAACWLGDACARWYSGPRVRVLLYDSRRWLLGSALLVLIGGLAYLRSRVLFPADFDASAELPASLSFLTPLLKYGFVMALIHFLYTGNRYSLCLSCLAGVYYLDRVALLGRRLDAFEFIFVVVGAIWFAWKKRPPRAVVLAAVMVALCMASVGAYRAVVVSTTGTTLTSMMDRYNSFWYLGCLEFLVIGYVMQRLYLRAAAGSMMAQAIYVYMMTQVLYAITHSTPWLVRPCVHVLFLWVPVMLYAAVAQTRPASNPRTAQARLTLTESA